jgi:anti-sigma-K factor RskA
MRRFARFLDALHESRRRKAERVIRRHDHLAAQAEAYQRRRAAEEAEAEKAALAPAASRMAARNA